VIFISRYVVATVLPPLLPTVFTVSVGISDKRLAKKQIACTNSEGILGAGKVKRAFFDKTGTLTKLGLSFHQMRDDLGH
jgi:P-type E1-E2 ATPase